MALQGIKMTVPAREPVVDGAPPVPVAAGDVSGGGDVTAPPPQEEEREERAVLGEQEDDDLTAGEDYSDEEEDDGDEDDGDDSEFEDDDRPPPPGVGIGEEAARSCVLLARVRFLGRPARFASVQSTASFMRLAAAEAVPPGEDGGGGGEILVRYCYTRFLAPQSGGDGVEMHAMGPKLARVRFLLPSHAAATAADPASSLRLAGAALASLGLYPSRFGAHLRELWSGLVTAAPVRVPPRTARLVVVVTVDVGILRPGDRTPARMRSMCAALESVARDGGDDDERPSSAFDAGMELRLPAPLASEDDARPAKRRRVTGEDCPICCEALERGLAAWPECSHIFHGSCLEEHLLRGYRECPMCRSGLKLNCPSTTIE